MPRDTAAIVAALEAAPPLGRGTLFDGAQYCAVGWLLHQAGVADATLMEHPETTGADAFGGQLVAAYGLLRHEVLNLALWNDTAPIPEHRAAYVLACVRRQWLPVAEGGLA